MLLSLSILSIFSLAVAQTVQNAWLLPIAPDNTTIVYLGQTIPISWAANLWEFFAQYAPDIDVQDADLWVGGFVQHQYRHLIANNVSVNGTNRVIQWEVNLPNDEISLINLWVFRFVQAGVDPLTTEEQISSPGFYIVDSQSAASSVSASISASSTSATSTSTMASTTISNSTQTAVTTHSVSTQTATPHSSSNSVSAGTIAGIVVGAVAGTAILITMGWLMAHVKKNSKSSRAQYQSDSTNRDDKMTFSPGDEMSHPFPSHQPPSYGIKTGHGVTNISELHNPQIAQPPAELGGSHTYRG